MASHALRGKKALESQNYEVAIEAYTAALQQSPTSPDYLIQRSIAYQRTKQYQEALADAENGVINARNRGKKEFIVESQLRRGIALYMLGRYADADFVLGLVNQQSPDHKQATMWINKTARAIDGLDENDERRKVTAQEVPLPQTARSTDVPSSGNKEPAPASPAVSAAPAPLPSALQHTPPDKIRHEWYQNTENVYFSLLVKGVPKDDAHITITERALSISFPLATGATYDFTLEPLFAPVKTEKCIKRVLASKIEITLVKATAGQKWSALESNEPAATPATGEASAAVADEAIKRAATQDTAPAYPTSSRTGPKNWDKISKELHTTDNSGQGNGDDDDDLGGGDAADNFFKKLYKGSSPEVQRAMMKSYIESNGTALSTNWAEVSKGKVETLPPDGVEAKPW